MFKVYPDTQPTPLPQQVASGATAALTFAQLTGPSSFPGIYAATMHLRVAMFGGAFAPGLSLSAGGGPALLLTANSTQINTPAGRLGDAKAVAEADNITRIQVDFDAETAVTWQLLIHNNDPTDTREFTFVVAQTLAETAQPWIDLALPDPLNPATPLTFHALVNESFDRSLRIRNLGTAPFTVTGLSTALDNLTATVPAAPVPPSGTGDLALTFTAPATPPAPDGTFNGQANVVVSPADTVAGTVQGHNQRLALSTSTQQVEVALLLDSSGSMGWDAVGGTPPSAQRSRWGELADAVGSGFLPLLVHFHDHGRFGIAHFPAPNPQDPHSADIVPIGPMPQDQAEITNIKNKVTAIVPSGGTPMGDGLQYVMNAPTGYFADDEVSRTSGRRWLLLMSDGANNSGVHNPLEFISPTAPKGNSFVDKNVSVFAVAYGIDGHTDVNHTLMKNLAAGSVNGGLEVNVDEENTTAQKLADKLRTPLKNGLTNATAGLDPQGTFVFGQDQEIRHEAVITPYDTKAAFVLDWNTPDPGRLRLELITPACERITPENAGQGRYAKVTFVGGNRSAIYLIDPEFLRGGGAGGVGDAGGERGEGGGEPDDRFGTWKFVVSSPPVIGVAGEGEASAEGEAAGRGGFATEDYTYELLVDSTLRIEVTTDKDVYFAGDPVTVRAQLTAKGRPVRGAAVSLSATAPERSANNQLAALRVPEEFLRRAEELLHGKDASPLLVKQVGAQLAGLGLLGGVREDRLAMADADDDGVYRAAVTDTAVPEQRTFYVTADGVTGDGVPFHREGKVETFIEVRPEPVGTLLDIRQSAPGLIDVTVTPRDRFGNVVFVDPDVTGGFGITALGGRPSGLTSRLDGTYTGTVSFDPKVTPSIGLQFGGVEVIPAKPVPDIGDLYYADCVLAYQPGEPTRGNEHTEPRQALGSVENKPDDQFVSLGAFGRLTVGIGHHVILPGAKDTDVTVFVHPDADPRPYRVEAQTVDHKQWVTLGESPGITASFSLRGGKVKQSRAIRVTDLSGRARGDDGLPLSSPGVSIRGIGAERIKKDSGTNSVSGGEEESEGTEGAGR
ncbi:vWA domain-containing protein [Streptomyces sp. ODS28]|uniref:vWA domain-containing protein n=1 Tax=Streptomyces sp. ODS28 TaxID=3136688 RepID=UPI0031E8EA14